VARAVSSGLSSGIGLDLTAAIPAPNDQPNLGGSTTERHRRAGSDFIDWRTERGRLAS
jgi:hypothetical protein